MALKHTLQACAELAAWLAISIVLSYCVWGCNLAQKTINETDWVKAKELVQTMSDAGIAGYVELELGQPGVIIEQKYGLDLGFKIRVRMLANPKTEAQP